MFNKSGISVLQNEKRFRDHRGNGCTIVRNVFNTIELDT